MAYKLFTVIACCYSLANDDDNDSALVLSSALAATFQVNLERKERIYYE